MAGQTTADAVGEHAATLALVEVALGSLLHAFRIPFSGTFLSLNQGFLLCRATLASQHLQGAKFVPYSVSNVAAVLKSLAPAGKKLGPMLSLSMQGLLFSLGLWIFGARLVGLVLGMLLLSLWAFVQPVLTYYLFFGERLFSAFAYVLEKTLPYLGLSLESLAWVFFGLVLLKLAAATALALFAWRTQGRLNYEDRLVRIAHERGLKTQLTEPKASLRPPLVLALRDLLRPIFLLSLAATAAFLYFAEHEGAGIGWLLLRPVAVAFLFFYFSRTLTLDRWLARLEGGRFHGFFAATRIALSRLRGSSHTKA